MMAHSQGRAIGLDRKVVKQAMSHLLRRNLFCQLPRRYSVDSSSVISAPPVKNSTEATGTEVETPAEKTAPVSVALASGTPESLTTTRQVFIYQAAKSTMQSGLAHNRSYWRIDFDQAQPRWENSLMGWTSSADPVQSVVLRFDTKEAAVNFATRQSWKYTVVEEPVARWKNKSYSNNFLYSANRLKFIRTK